MGIYIQECRFFPFPITVRDMNVLNRVGKGVQYSRKTQKGFSKSIQLLQCSLPSVSPGGAEVKEAGSNKKITQVTVMVESEISSLQALTLHRDDPEQPKSSALQRYSS